MNMMISTAPVAVRASAGSQALAASSQAGESGFSGVLVQAITGTTDAASTGSTPLSQGLTGLFGQLGLSQKDGQTEDLMQLLANLVEQLQQLEEGDTLSDEQLSSLADLLAMFQSVVQQLEFLQWTVSMDSDDGSMPLFGFTAAQASPSTQTTQALVVGTMRQTLQQLMTLLNNDEVVAAEASTLGSEIKTLLQALGSQLSAESGEAKTQASEGQANSKIQVERSDVSKASDISTNSQTKDAANQAQSATVEIKRVSSALRDPVWRFQVVDGNDSVSSDSLIANVAPVLAGEETSETGSQPAWTLLSHDAKSAEPVQVKQVVTAQVPVQQFAQQVEKLLVKQFLLAQTGGVIEAKLSLTPEHLGQIDVRILMQNGQLTAQFVAENGMARDLIENQMAQLRSSLQAQGLQVERLEVVQQSSSSSSASFLQQDHRQQTSGGNGNRGQTQDSGTYDETLGFEDEFELSSTLRELAYGNSLNVTA